MRDHRYAEKAVRVRELAASSPDPNLKRQLAVIAEDYDHMAEIEHRIERAQLLDGPESQQNRGGAVKA